MSPVLIATAIDTTRGNRLLNRVTIALYFAVISPVIQAETIYVCSQLGGTITAYDAVSGAVQAPIANGLSSPTGLAVDASGNLYISDFGNNVIRKYAISTGTLSIF